MTFQPLAIEPAIEPSARIGRNMFKRVSSYIEQHTGIKMPASKAQMLEGRLMRRVRDHAFPSVDAYCEHILSGEADDEMLRDFINAITTNKTDFFRESSHFDYIQRTILPMLEQEGRRIVRAWSAAASTGMEAYTLAMVLDQALMQQRGVDFSILATDIDTNVLEEARRGIYPSMAFDPVPADMRRRYVANALDPARQEGRIIPRLRSKIAFARLNLMDSQYPVGEAMDIILCRNVLIYFDKPTQERVIGRLCDRLRPGGHLVLGHSESIHGMNLPLATVSNTVFRKKD
ncbi:MAG TPA: protein-glutamate O-methyltransferase CheR [Novosphingobium sp.]|nr:protein-glutamate O-methyltransferase CheR [Novosphingobium sp.]